MIPVPRSIPLAEGDEPHAVIMSWVMQRLEALEGEEEMAKVWETLAHSSPTVGVYENRLAEILRETGCAAEGAPYVLRELLARLEGSAHLVSTRSIAPARALTDAEKAKLKAMLDHPPPPAPKQ
jgi:hypothetical protein